MSYTLKAIKPINNYLNNWLKENKFDCRAEFDDEFLYDLENGNIHYSLVVPKSHDIYYLKLVKFYAPEIEECDNFILSFFHELGHNQTEMDFSDIEFDAYGEFLQKIDEKFNSENSETTEWDYLKYYMHPIEIAATEWAVQYILGNPRKIKKFIDGLRPLVLNFIEKNNIELDEEEQKMIDKYKEAENNG